jgi:RNA polymerase sigma-54 factor
MSKQHLSLEQRLGLRMSPRQMQLMRLLQVPTVELLSSIREEMENNPVLEDEQEFSEGEDSSQEQEQEREQEQEQDIEKTEDFLEDYFNEDEFDSYKERSVQQENRYERPAVGYAGFQEQVLQQFGMLPVSPVEQIIGEAIIGNLDDDGYLARSTQAISNDLAFSQNVFVTTKQVEDVLKMVQNLDPSGIGARSLRESLQIQLQRSDEFDHDISELAKKIVANDKRFYEFTSRKYDLLTKRFKVSSDELKEAISLITRLNPRPGGNVQSLNPIVIPDFIITVFENEINVSLNRDYEPNLRVNPAYSKMLTEYVSNRPSNNETVTFIKQKIENARSFIDLIKQRQTTLLDVMQTIVNLQKDYFLTGEQSMIRPMILKDVAEKTDLDISTISRITANKYAQTPYGIILLKELFSQGMQNEEGEDVSSIEVKDTLKKIVASENKKKPLTDDSLAKEIKKSGYAISRRTVTKYREMLNIPVARLRREA